MKQWSRFTGGIPNVRRFSVAVLGGALVVAGGAAGAQTPTLISPTPTPAATGREYPPGVNIDVALTVPVSSETAHVGDTFSFNTTDEVKLGGIDVPAGTAGHGRLAVVVPAQGDGNGALSLQADSIDLPDGTTVWVNIDTSVAPRGHYSRQHTRTLIIPLPVGIVPVFTHHSQGDMVLDTGTRFRVVTISPRKVPAPLLTAPPTEAPAMPAASPAIPAASPSA